MRNANIDFRLCSKKELYEFIRRSYGDPSFMARAILLHERLRRDKDVDVIELFLNLPRKSIIPLMRSVHTPGFILGNIRLIDPTVSVTKADNILRMQLQYLEQLNEDDSGLCDVVVSRLWPSNLPLVTKWLEQIPTNRTIAIQLPNSIPDGNRMDFLDAICTGLERGILPILDVFRHSMFQHIIETPRAQKYLMAHHDWHKPLMSSEFILWRSLHDVRPLLSCVDISTISKDLSTRKLQILRTLHDPHCSSALQGYVDTANMLVELPPCSHTGSGFFKLLYCHPMLQFFQMIDDQLENTLGKEVLDIAFEIS